MAPVRKAKATPVWKPFPGAQERFLSCPAWEVLLHGNRGGGKSQPLWSNILTPEGYKFMGDLSVGSEVICPIEGSVKKIAAIFPQGKIDVYKIITEYGFTFCSLDHLWMIKFEENSRSQFVLRRTKDLIEFLERDIPVYIPKYYKNPYNVGLSEVLKIEKYFKQDFCQCIKVDSIDGLYVTDNYLVTHNTDVLLMDFLQDVGKGYGLDYRGLILREATTELADIINKSKKWINQIFPGAKFNSQRKIWTFPGNETLWFNYARIEDDYAQYHGQEIPFIGFEELTNWPLSNIYLKLMSCNRTSNTNIRRKYRATCNPSGPGHTWVKERFIDKGPPEKIIKDEFGQTRTHIQSRLEENRALLEADPYYMAKLLAMTQDNKMLRDAWVMGSWDLITGGFFTDVWDSKIHVLPNFEIPKSWQLIRSFDWGSSKPWCVTYGVESNGDQPLDPDIPFIPRGSVIVIDEIYGWNGNANEGDQATSQEIAERVVAVDHKLKIEHGLVCYGGPADNAIWEVRDGTSIGHNLSKHGCRWTKSYKGPGSRIAGWALIRQMLGAAKRGDIETPHLYFFSQAAHHIRTLPIQQRDPKKPEDIEEGEDHAMDSLRYLLTRKMLKMKRRKVGY